MNFLIKFCLILTMLLLMAILKTARDIATILWRIFEVLFLLDDDLEGDYAEDREQDASQYEA